MTRWTAAFAATVRWKYSSVLGLGPIRLAARSLADALERESLREAARELMRRAANVESPAPASGWRLPRSSLPANRTVVMGVVNATPDSFSDGGAYDPVAQGLKLAEEGADIIDVGDGSAKRWKRNACNPE